MGGVAGAAHRTRELHAVNRAPLHPCVLERVELADFIEDADAESTEEELTTP